jgi:hypothetical protein
MTASPPAPQIQIWSIDRLVFYARNPRKNDAAVDRMCSSIREFGFKCPVLARSDGTVVDGHLRLKAARKLGSWPGGEPGTNFTSYGSLTRRALGSKRIAISFGPWK